MTTSSKIKPPSTLLVPGKQMFASVAQEYLIDDSVGLKLLQSACEAYDLIQQCEAQLKADGLMIGPPDRRKVHPLLSTVRDARSAMLQNLKALNCDLEPLKNVGRPAGGRGV